MFLKNFEKKKLCELISFKNFKYIQRLTKRHLKKTF